MVRILNNCIITVLLLNLAVSFICAVNAHGDEAPAATGPETVIVSGPDGKIGYSNIAFWWIGKATHPFDTASPTQDKPSKRVIGYYYQLDESQFIFTESNHVVFYQLPGGTHKFSVKAVDETLAEDESPAIRIFNIASEVALEQEINNTDASANRLSTDVELRGVSNDNEDDDWFRVAPRSSTVPTGLFLTHITFFFWRTALSKTKTQLTIYKSSVSDANKMYEEIVDAETQQLAVFTSATNTSEEWFINVHPLSVDETNVLHKYYNITVAVSNLFNASWDMEHNADAVFANELRLAGDDTAVVFGKADKPQDVDWYKIHIPYSTLKQLHIDLTRPYGKGKTDVDIYRSLPIASSRQVGHITIDAAEGQQYASFQTAVAFGDYFLKVDNDENVISPEATQPDFYIINISLNAIPEGKTVELEPNGGDTDFGFRISDFGFKNKLPIGVRMYGDSWDGNTDFDWYGIVVPPSREDSGLLALTLSRPSGVGTTKLELSNPTSTHLAELTITTDNEQRGQLIAPVKEGTHYIKIMPQDEADGSPYQLSALYINSVKHDVTAPLTVGQTVTVTLDWIPGNTATFDILFNSEFRIPNSEFRDDGQHNDGDADDGLYVGSYTVLEEDDVSDALIVVHIKESLYGITADVTLEPTITIDTLPPEIISLTHDGAGVLSAGDTLTVTLVGEPFCVATFDILFNSEIRNPKSEIRGLPLFDDGQHSDGDANDGVYVGVYNVNKEDNLSEESLTASLVDDAGNETRITAETPVTIRGDFPKIETAWHDATTALKLGDVLNVTVKGGASNVATFDILFNSEIRNPKSEIRGLPMFDDGQHDDGAPKDGIYSGSYVVAAGDNLKQAIVTVNLTDKRGKISQISLEEPVTLDGLPPQEVIGVVGGDKPDDEGVALIVSWLPSSAPDLSHYNVYFSTSPIHTLDDIEPFRTSIVETSAEIDVPEESDLYYYIAVTAVDSVGNESALAEESHAGPLRAMDNLPPASIVGLMGFDTPHDTGRSLTLQWSQPTTARDFSHYNVYISLEPIRKTENGGRKTEDELPTSEIRNPIAPIRTVIHREQLTIDLLTEFDNVDYFCAVTAVDTSGNESAITADSAVGPIQSKDNTVLQPEKPVRITFGPSGLIRYSDVTFQWNRFSPGENLVEIIQLPNYGYIYRLDNGEPRFTTDSSVTLYDVSDGEHRFAVARAPLRLESDYTIRFFTVGKMLLRELEPNDTPSSATELPLAYTIFGSLAEEDDDYYRLELKDSEGIVNISCEFGILNSEFRIPTMRLYKGIVSPDTLIEMMTIDDNTNWHATLSVGSNTRIYYVQISGASSNSSPPETNYELSADFHPIELPDVWEVELNDTAGDAQVLDTTRTLANSATLELTGASHADGDEDWYRLTGPSAAQFLRLHAYRPSSISTTLITIYSTFPIQEANKIGSLHLDAHNSQAAEFMTPIVQQDYYIQVRSTEREPVYSILVSFADIDSKETWELEPNNRDADANTLGIGKRLHSVIYLDDTDWYRVNVAEKGILVLSLARALSLGDITVTMHDARLDEIASVHVPQSQSRVYLSSEVSKGTYFLSVAPFSESVDGQLPPSQEYQLTAMFVKKSSHDAVSADGTTRTLTLGDSLTVTLNWTATKGQIAGNTATFLPLFNSEFRIPNSEFREDIPLFDDGMHDDGDADDGVYVGRWDVPDGIQRSAVDISITLTDANGNTAMFSVPPPIDIDTVSSPITSLVHDATEPLIMGNTLTVTLTGEKGGIATFDICAKPSRESGECLRRNLLMFDDGEHNDGEADDGVYVGQYEVRAGDYVVDASLTAQLTKANGRAVERTATKTITIDTVPPQPVTGVAAIDKPDDEGLELSLTWDASTADDLVYYNIYISRTPIGLTNYELRITNYELKTMPSYTLVVGENGVEYYIAVSAVDGAGNESSLALSSVTGPVMAQDDRSPPPVERLLGFDTPDDAGKSITLKWTRPSSVNDFDHYNIYFSNKPIIAADYRPAADQKITLMPIAQSALFPSVSSLPSENRRLLLTVDVTVPTDKVNYYFAITAVDSSGNESSLTDNSRVGPIQSQNNLTPQPQTDIQFIFAPVGLVRHDDVAFQWNRYKAADDDIDSAPMMEYFYRVDGGPMRLTAAARVELYNLTNGAHTFAVKSREATDYITQRFTVDKTVVHEMPSLSGQPNDRPEFAIPLIPGPTFASVSKGTNYYLLNMSQPGIANISVSQQMGETHVNVYSGRVAPETLAGTMIVGPTTQWRGILSVGVDVGEYILELSGAEETAYELSAVAYPIVEPIIIDIEPNNTAQEANRATFFTHTIEHVEESQIYGTSYGGDADIYYLSRAKSTMRWMTMKAFCEAIEGDIQVRLFSRTFHQDQQIAELRLNLPGTPFTMTHLLADSKDYFLEVRNIVGGQEGNGAMGQEGNNERISEHPSLDTRNYSIYLSLSDTPTDRIWEQEPNGSRLNANSLGVFSPQSHRESVWGTSFSESDGDWYTLHISGSGILLLTLWKAEDTAELSLYDSKENVLNTLRIDTNTLQKGQLATEIQRGNYYIHIAADIQTARIESARSNNQRLYALYQLTVFFISTSKYTIHREEMNVTLPTVAIADDILGVNVMWQPGNDVRFSLSDMEMEKIPLFDDGEHDDGSADDGIYHGIYTIQPGDDISDASVIVRLRDKWDNTADLTLSPTLSIDTEEPNIQSVFVDAQTQLKAGTTLTVTLIGEASASASFEIIKESSDLPLPNSEFRIPNSGERLVMFDDGAHGDNAPNDGIYTGTYVVAADDNVTDAQVTAWLIDAAGNVAWRTAAQSVSFDTIPPDILDVRHDAEHILTETDTLAVTLTGETGCEGTFDIFDSRKGVNFRTGLRMYPALIAPQVPNPKSEIGVYVGTYRVRPSDQIAAATLHAVLTDAAGNQSTLDAFELINIDALAPVITEVSYNALSPDFQTIPAGHPLALDSTLTVRLVSDITKDPIGGASATFRIEGLEAAQDLPLYDDGIHDDEAAQDGIYVGTYTVQKEDDVKDARVTCTLVKANGKSTTKFALARVTIDSIAPSSVTNVTAEDKPADQGSHILLKWQDSAEGDFNHYNIYLSSNPIVLLSSMEPHTRINQLRITETELEVPKNNIDYYCALTAVDVAGNESVLQLGDGGSVSDPTRAQDNLRPLPVRGVNAIDTPDDFGGSITVSWGEPSSAPDFDRYNIYLSEMPVENIEGLKLVDTITDRFLMSVDVSVGQDNVNYYVAVTAVDINGNESTLTLSQSVQSTREQTGGETQVQIISGPIGQIRQRAVTFYWSRWPANFGEDGDRFTGYFYQLDGNDIQFTEANTLTFYDLREGRHDFAVRAVGIDTMTSRSFSVLPTFTSESEPNDEPIYHNLLTTSAIMRGYNADDNVADDELRPDVDWYLMQISEGGQLDLFMQRPEGIGRTIVNIFSADALSEDAKLGEFIITVNNRQRNHLSMGVHIGSYLISVSSENEDATAEYELSASTTVLRDKYRWEVEPNNFEQFATPIPSDAYEIYGIANKASDSDWYRLNVSKEQPIMLRFEVTRPLSMYTTYVNVYAGLPIVPEKQIGSLLLTPQNNQYDILVTPVHTGAYFIHIDNKDEMEPTLYVLRTTFTEIDDYWELEPNGTRGQANELPLNDAIFGTSWHPNDDVDWYRFSITEKNILSLACKRKNGAGTTQVRLLTAGAAEISGFMIASETGQIGYLDLEMRPGEYLVEMQPNDEDSQTSYSLTALLIKMAEHDAAPNVVLGSGATLTVKIRKAGKPESQKAGQKQNPITQVTFGIVDADGETVLLPEAELMMFDDGTHVEHPDEDGGDGQKDDGIYARTYTVQPGVNVVDGIVFINFYGDDQSPMGKIHLKHPVTIDTLPPTIIELRHDAVEPGLRPRPLGVNDKLKIFLKATDNPKDRFTPAPLVGSKAFFQIQKGNFKIEEELFDDGNHDDGAENDGIYGGQYTIRLGDNVEEAAVTAHIYDWANNEAIAATAIPVILDTIKPAIKSIIPTVIATVDDRPLDISSPLLTGDILQITLTGEARRAQGTAPTATFDIRQDAQEYARENIPLFDDGTHGDETPDDGVYTNTYIIPDGDNVKNAVIIGHLTDAASNVGELESTILISIDTESPQIQSITLLLGEGRPPYPPLPRAIRLIEEDVLIVVLTGEPGGTATFDIGDFKIGLPLADDGAGDDEKANDGVYVGSYEVVADDDAFEAVIAGHLEDTSGNEEIKYATQKVTIDAQSPSEVTDIVAMDSPDDEGNIILVSWQPSTAIDFARYNIYGQAEEIIDSTLGLIPLPTLGANLFKRETTTAKVIVPQNNVNYYFAVTVVDFANNESPLGDSSFTKETTLAQDNIRPQPVVIQSVTDRLDDQGKTLTVKWRQNMAEDFSAYKIYVADQPIIPIEGAPWTEHPSPKRMEPLDIDLLARDVLETDIPVLTDGKNYYIAMTAQDHNGNESLLDELGRSIVGPVQSHDETPPTPVTGVIALDTPSDTGGSITVSWLAKENEDVSHYNIYLANQTENGERKTENGTSVFPPSTSDFRTPIVVRGEENDITEISTDDGIDYYVIVTAVDFGGNESILEENGNSSSGPVQSVVNIIMAAQETVITAGFDEKTKVIIPPDAVADVPDFGADMIDIFIPTDKILLGKIDEANYYASGAVSSESLSQRTQSHIDTEFEEQLRTTVREFVFTGEKLFRPVTIEISYPENIISRTKEGNLRIFRLNDIERTAAWELVPGKQRVNEINTVTAQVDRLGVFRIALLKLPDDLKNVVVFPNPFVPSESISGKVTFKNLTEDAVIFIYTINGELVRELEVDLSSVSAQWDGKNEYGQDVASGLYIYMIKSELDKTIGRIMVMR